jgi:histidine decarboxylase
VERFALVNDQDDRLGGELSHIVVMQHVTKDRLQKFLEELAKCK